MLKHLTVQDLHLYDREMRSTKGMVENSNVILEELYKFLVENKDIVILNINGDIQHKTPTNRFNRKEVALWRKQFTKIGELMLKRFKKHVKGFSLAGASEKLKDDLKRGKVYPIFTTRGNHDIDSEIGHTFYDDLLAEGLIINVKGLLVKVEESKTYFSYRDYGTEDRRLPKLKSDVDVIALEHNDVLHDESLLWNIPNAEEKFLKAEEVVKGTDVTILGHIHERVDPLKIGDSILWQSGSLGRTSFSEYHKRDVGYGAVMNFGDVENFGTVEFDLIPYKEYFSYKKMTQKKKYENEFKDFDLKMEDVERVSTNYREDINSMDVEEEVKEYAISVMDSIENNG